MQKGVSHRFVSFTPPRPDGAWSRHAHALRCCSLLPTQQKNAPAATIGTITSTSVTIITLSPAAAPQQNPIIRALLTETLSSSTTPSPPATPTSALAAPPPTSGAAAHTNVPRPIGVDLDSKSSTSLTASPGLRHDTPRFALRSVQ